MLTVDLNASEAHILWKMLHNLYQSTLGQGPSGSTTLLLFVMGSVMRRNKTSSVQQISSRQIIHRLPLLLPHLLNYSGNIFTVIDPRMMPALKPQLHITEHIGHATLPHFIVPGE